MFRRTKYKNIGKNFSGFTLIELLVTLSIIAILSGIVISSNYSTNKARNALMVDTDLLASTIRDMQNRSASFVVNPLVNNLGYGVFMDLNNPLKVETFYKLVAGNFDSNTEIPSGNKPADDFIFNPGISLKKICLNGCNTKQILPAGKLAIYFLGPKPYAYFSYSDNGLNYYNQLGGQAINQACLEIESQILPNDTRKLEIYYIGQISFSYGKCDN